METLGKIKQTLEKMLVIHKRLLDLEKEKQMVLVNGDAKLLQNVINQESTLVEQIGKLEGERQQQVKQFASEKKLPSQISTVNDLIRCLDNQEEKSSLIQSAQQLTVLVEEIQQLVKSNQELIKLSLSYVQYSMGILIQREPAIGYGPRSSKGHVNFLDAKA
ncbi:MAG TPA: flagellar protein FlgN [Bacillota bacterium]|nr:flagellar protein FlgN [Bacillota bacterium]